MVKGLSVVEYSDGTVSGKIKEIWEEVIRC
jgi:hypothetical protein